MILNALDEVLFWDNISVLKNFIYQNTAKYYPHDPKKFYVEKDVFLNKHIPNKDTFISKIVSYSKNGAAIWVSGRNGFNDDIDKNTMLKAITTNSRTVNGLGIATSLWNLPFENEMFASICCNAGLEECREIPKILKEAVRVLASQGRITIRCLKQEKVLWYSYFEKYGISTMEARKLLCNARLFFGVELVSELLINMGLSLLDQKDDENLGHIIVFEKLKPSTCINIPNFSLIG